MPMALRPEDPNVMVGFLEWVVTHLEQHVLTKPNIRERRTAADSVTITTFKHLKDYLPLELRALVSTILELEERAWQPVQREPSTPTCAPHRRFPWWFRKQPPAQTARPAKTRPVHADHQIDEAVSFLRAQEGQEEHDPIAIGIIRGILPPDGQRPTCYLIYVPGDPTMPLVPVHQILA